MAFNEDDLTNLILSTLGEMENDIKKSSNTKHIIKTDESQTSQLKPLKEIKNNQNIKQPLQNIEKKKLIPIIKTNISGKEINTKTQSQFLLELREKMLVLFTGLQSEKLVNKQDKIDLVLNYLEYTLASIDERIEKL
jgi:hypothetical protein